MTTTVERIWLSNGGRELLKKKANGDYYIAPAQLDVSELRELREAIEAALSDDAWTVEEILAREG
jgi:hypothetical protein